MTMDFRKDIAAKLCPMLPTFRRALKIPVESTMPKEITKSQAVILMHLAKLRRINMSALAEHIMISPQQLSKAIAELEEAGYVIRHNDKQHRRLVWVELSMLGQQLIERHKEQMQEHLLQTMQTLSDTEVEQLYQSLVTVKDIIDKIMPPKGDNSNI